MRLGPIDIVEISTEYFDLKHTFESAQPLTFYADYNEASNTLTYPFGVHIINMMHSGGSRKGKITIVSKDISNAERDVRKRFRLMDDMPKIYKKISTDKFMEDSIKKYEGMRLTVNDPWETTLVFILSQFNNVKRIRLITRNIIQRFGREIRDENGTVIAKSFPESPDLLNATEQDFRDLGSGFRAKYLKELADYCTNNINLNRLNGNKYDELKENLMSIKGVGEKVADCIALMGYGNLEAFPIDVWVKRTMERVYFNGKSKKTKEIQEFAYEKWGKQRGYAQQYAFHRGRQSGRKQE